MRLRQLAVLTGFLPVFLASPLYPQAGKNEKKDAGKKAEKPEKKSGEGRKKAEPESYDLNTQGVVGAPAKSGGDFYDFTYSVLEGKKRANKKAWIKIDSSTTIIKDRMAQLSEFKEGDSLMIFGKPVEREAPSTGGIATGKPLRVIQASRVVLGGKSLTVNEAYADPRDKAFAWCDAKVEKAGAAVTVNYSNASYKLALDQQPAIFLRGDGDLKRDVKKGAKLIAQGNTVSEKPDGEEERPTFKIVQAIVMEPRLLRWYDALLP
jgi:hypothetical protein